MFHIFFDLCITGVAAFGRKPDFSIFQICGALLKRRYNTQRICRRM
jgi:hypothetical protein